MPSQHRQRTKIVATIGPASNSREMLRQLAEAGATVFRLNFSHGAHAEHARVLGLIRAVSIELGMPLVALADLCGPKLRLGDVPGGSVLVQANSMVTLTSHKTSPTDARRFSVNFSDLDKHVAPGRLILLDDGTVRLVVERIDGEDVLCRVVHESVIKSRKGINLPGTYLPIPALTEKDEADLRFVLKEGIDLVALSFVRSAADLQRAYDVMDDVGIRVPLVAKIEKPEAVAVLDEILMKADGAMVARGDLGVEMPIEEMPATQARIIRRCNELGKPVITATQMLNSMISAPSPTRAEVTDIYNAILCGTDSVMLSAETAAGSFPVESVQMMSKVAREAEDDMAGSRELLWTPDAADRNAVGEAVCSAAVGLAVNVGLDAIVVATATGHTALRLCRYRPRCPIYAFSTSIHIHGLLGIAWGVETRSMRELWGTEEETGEMDAIVRAALSSALDNGLLRHGDRAVVVAGIPLRVPGNTNLLRVVTIDPPQSLSTIVRKL